MNVNFCKRFSVIGSQPASGGHMVRGTSRGWPTTENREPTTAWRDAPRVLPARLTHARDHPEQRQLAEADAAEAEAAQERARPTTAAAAVVHPDLELRLPLALLD